MLFKILFVLYSISSIVSLFGSCAALAGSANKMWIYIFIMSATNVAIFGKLISMNDSIALFASNKVSGYFVEETYWEVKEQIMREQPLNG